MKNTRVMRRKQAKPVIGMAVIAAVILAASCQKQQLSPISEQPGVVRYQTHIQPIIESSCIECHDISSDIPLNDYDRLVDVARTGQLEGSLTGDPNYTQMPPYGELDPHSVSLIQQWIEQGYLE